MQHKKIEDFQCVVCESKNIIDGHPNDYNVVCNDHKELANFYQVEIWKERAGIIERKKHKCEICEADLSSEEVDSIDVRRDFSITCLKHRCFADVFQSKTLAELYKNGLLPETPKNLHQIVVDFYNKPKPFKPDTIQTNKP